MALIYKVLRIESQRAFVGRRIFSEGISMARAAHPRTLSSLSPSSLSEWSEREKRISNGFISTGLELTACIQWSGLDPHCTSKTHHTGVVGRTGTTAPNRRQHHPLPTWTPLNQRGRHHSDRHRHPRPTWTSLTPRRRDPPTRLLCLVFQPGALSLPPSLQLLFLLISFLTCHLAPRVYQEHTHTHWRAHLPEGGTLNP